MKPVWLTASALGMGFQDCGTCGATVPWKNVQQHENFHATFTNRSDGNMSTVLWCDTGDHPFKAGVPGAAHFEGTQTNAEGAQQSMSQDVCPEHNPYAPADVKEAAQHKRLNDARVTLREKRLARDAATELIDRGE